MKRKGERNIPDFSKKPKLASHEAPNAKPLRDRPLQPKTQAKPQATSSKSGHRGV